MIHPLSKTAAACRSSLPLLLKTRNGNEEENPKEIDLRPKLAVKETENNQENKETEMK